MTLETLAWVALSAILAIPITVLTMAVLEGGVTPAMLAPGLLAAFPLWLGAFAGAWIGVATIEERHLFEYFKTR